jgi:hypothetical protein
VLKPTAADTRAPSVAPPNSAAQSMQRGASSSGIQRGDLRAWTSRPLCLELRNKNGRHIGKLPVNS